MYSDGPCDLAACSAGPDPKKGSREADARIRDKWNKDRLASMKHTYREISDGCKRRDRTTKRHYETTSTIGHRREIPKETLMNGEDNIKGFERRLHITIRNSEGQVTHKHGTNGLVSGGDRNRDVSKEESGSRKDIVPVLGSLAC